MEGYSPRTPFFLGKFFGLNCYIYYGSLGFAVVNARFWGVSGVYTPLTPQNLGTSPPIPKEPLLLPEAKDLKAVENQHWIDSNPCSDLKDIPKKPLLEGLVV